MAKTASQRQQEHVARLRRKAQAYDLLVIQLNALLNAQPVSGTGMPSNQYDPTPAIRNVVLWAEQAVQE